MRSDAGSRAATRAEDLADPEADTGASIAGVHRLRDLGPRDRWIALALGLILLVAPVSSAVRQFGTWTPTGDDALIEIRARDAFTAESPLIGQPSSTSLYGRRERNAAHPGPIEFYLLAPAERLVGGGVGMLSTIAVTSGLSVLLIAWAVFRQLGRGAGLAAAVALAAVMWTAGAAAIVDPRSSAVGRFPLMCSVVLLWCLMCGDVRLLAISGVWVSFTAQQHLSVLPVTLVVTAVGVVGFVVALLRGRMLADRTSRRTVARHVGLAAAVGLVVWAPVLYEQFSRSPGNLERIARYAGDSSRTDVGYGSALRQLAHAVGLPPLLGRVNVTGLQMLARVSVLTWISAIVAGALGVTAAVLWRRSRPRQAALVIMAGAVAVGGFLNGASVPYSIEQRRIAFYHWTFTLAFLEFLILLLAVGPVIWRWYVAREPSQSATARVLVGPIVCVLVLVPALANLGVNRRDNRLLILASKPMVDHIESQVIARTRDLPGPTLFLSTEFLNFSGTYEAVAARLVADGMDLKFPPDRRDYVADQHLVDNSVRSGLVIAFGLGGPRKGVPGTLIATANPAPGLDRPALARLIRQARSSSQVVLGARLEQALDERLREQLSPPGLPEQEQARLRLLAKADRSSLTSINKDPVKVLTDSRLLPILLETPLVAPALDRSDLASVLRTFPTEQGVAMSATHLSVYRLDREQLVRFAPQRNVQIGAG